MPIHKVIVIGLKHYFVFFCKFGKPLVREILNFLRIFSIRRKFARGAEFFFVLFTFVRVERVQTMKISAARTKFRLEENSLYRQQYYVKLMPHSFFTLYNVYTKKLQPFYTTFRICMI